MAPCKQFFSHLIQTFEGYGKRTQKKLSDIISYLLVDFISVAASAPGGSIAALLLACIF